MVGRRKIVLTDEQYEFMYDLVLELKGVFSRQVWHDFKLKFVDSTIAIVTLKRRFEEMSAQVKQDQDNSSNITMLRFIYIYFDQVYLLLLYVSSSQEHVDMQHQRTL